MRVASVCPEDPEDPPKTPEDPQTASLAPNDSTTMRVSCPESALPRGTIDGQPAEPAAVHQQARRRLEKSSQTVCSVSLLRVSIDRSQRAAPGGVMVPMYEPQV
jgi:hypothetical protein